MYELQKSCSKADETKLWQAIADLPSAIDQRDDASVDARMQTVEAEFSRIALQTNPNLASDQEKYKREIAANVAADAKAAVDAAQAAAVDAAQTAAANAKTPEERLNVLLR